MKLTAKEVLNLSCANLEDGNLEDGFEVILQTIKLEAQKGKTEVSITIDLDTYASFFIGMLTELDFVVEKINNEKYLVSWDKAS